MFNNMSDITLLTLNLFFIGIFALVCYMVYLNNKYKTKVLEKSAYSINIQSVIDESIPQILDVIINECFEYYKILVLIPRQEYYISDERETQIREDLAKRVAERISPVTIDKLSLYYNVDNLSDVIGEKIYVTVMNYVIEVNSLKEDKKDIPKK